MSIVGKNILYILIMFVALVVLTALITAFILHFKLVYVGGHGYGAIGLIMAVAAVVLPISLVASYFWLKKKWHTYKYGIVLLSAPAFLTLVITIYELVD